LDGLCKKPHFANDPEYYLTNVEITEATGQDPDAHDHDDFDHEGHDHDDDEGHED
jgi:hypothetical protein